MLKEKVSHTALNFSKEKASDGTRTHDLLITNQLLYHLSHTSIINRINPAFILYYTRFNLSISKTKKQTQKWGA